MNVHDDNKLDHRSPVIIFGTGGSGTRVVSQILEKSGCFIGNNINAALDNQDFGFLLSGRIKWIEKYFPFKYQNARVYLNIFDKIYFKQKLSGFDFFLIFKIFLEYLFNKNKQLLTSISIKNRVASGKKLLGLTSGPSNNIPDIYKMWGFKSPPAIYFIKPLCVHYPGVKLIHVLRDGRDISLSKNTKPLLYRDIFKINSPDTVLAGFYNWCAVNTWAYNLCQKKLPAHQYLMIKYEEICTKPRESVNKLLEWSGLVPKDIQQLYKIPHKSKSIGRWKKYKHIFENLDDSSLKQLGYN
jgi:hypothetical protein